MKNIKISGLIIFSVALLLQACTKSTDYRKYYAYGQDVYPATAPDLHAYGGLNRLLLVWGPQVDPSVVKYEIYWNNGGGADSMSYTPPSGKTGLDSVFIDNLSETDVYTISIYSYDAKGNKSIPVELQNAVVYGSIYSSNLTNRGFTYDYFGGGNDTTYLNWFANTDTSNLTTKVWYTDKSGKVQTIFIPADSSGLMKIPNMVLNSTVYYQSGYKPSSNSPDTFYTSKPDTLIVNYRFAGTYTWTALSGNNVNSGTSTVILSSSTDNPFRLNAAYLAGYSGYSAYPPSYNIDLSTYKVTVDCPVLDVSGYSDFRNNFNPKTGVITAWWQDPYGDVMNETYTFLNP
ncbi:hypothetical protein A9P82_11725 [Arachidicoccus ginsenosidimutans]|uniref:DUF4998 domain-containing protein n=1 Tax=Arachidicoccus sp. BS20 TaxID=1850526 RepID=UPI0007F123B7|nr:DUF4998 domain-containing protein [Arachidicoccus sp. BS20]ANI89895.1 hypothetical protein A9P82_11725 [Arachidicoccus sp. BS20]